MRTQFRESLVFREATVTKNSNLRSLVKDSPHSSSPTFELDFGDKIHIYNSSKR